MLKRDKTRKKRESTWYNICMQKSSRSLMAPNNMVTPMPVLIPSTPLVSTIIRYILDWCRYSFNNISTVNQFNQFIFGTVAANVSLLLSVIFLFWLYFIDFFFIFFFLKYVKYEWAYSRIDSSFVQKQQKVTAFKATSCTSDMDSVSAVKW
jgi:hypothetical protein